MGCDIHVYIEFKKGDAPWTADEHHRYDPEDNYVNAVQASGRDYNLFGKLAGVRSAGPQPKGFPNDASDIVLKASEIWGGDAHSHSFSSLAEFRFELVKSGYKFLKETRAEAFGDMRLGFGNLYLYCRNKKKELKMDLEAEKMLLGQKINTTVKCRLVYFFDN
jgi:hypothetical protein